jgi:hypothetical protein
MAASNPGPHPPNQALKMIAQKNNEPGVAGKNFRKNIVTIAAAATKRTAATYSTTVARPRRKGHSGFIRYSSGLIPLCSCTKENQGGTGMVLEC